jgi:nitrite reductase/ring-hydroxylating ferredoxin subunit
MSEAQAGTSRLCALGDLPDGTEREGREFSPYRGGRESIFLVRRGREVHGYRNRCPHTGSPLNWMPDHFLDRERHHIVCASHGAMFRVEDGFCVAGPCAGDELTPVPLEIHDGDVHLVLEASD